ncbi:MAG: signal peptidase II [Candidatus Binatia bacterium]
MSLVVRQPQWVISTNKNRFDFPPPWLILLIGIDFLDFYWSRFHWPAFNFANSFITVGVILSLYRLITAKGGDPFIPGGD